MLWKLTLPALCLAAFAGLGACVPPGEDGDGGDYYAGGYGGGYCDAWGCPDEFWDYPVYYGSIYYDGAWLTGPVYCRDISGRREYWVHGGWHNDGWRGERPAQYPAGRVGPALGRDFYRNAGNGSGNSGGRTRTFRENDIGLSSQSLQGSSNGGSSNSNNGGNAGTAGGNRGGGNRGDGGGRGGGFNGGGNRGGGNGGGGNRGDGGGYRGSGGNGGGGGGNGGGHGGGSGGGGGGNNGGGGHGGGGGGGSSGGGGGGGGSNGGGGGGGHGGGGNNGGGGGRR